MTTHPPLTLRRAALGIALVALLAHLGLGVGGVWSFSPLNYDDPQVLALAGQRSVREIVTEPTWYAYKPVYLLSVKVDTLFGDWTSGVAHVHNALLHALAAALLFLVLAGLLRNRWIAGAAALLFAVHPVHVESVAWISGRKDVLSLVLVLAAHLLYRRARDAGRVSVAAPVLLVLGGLTKGTVWIWSGVLLLDEIVEAARRRREGTPTAPAALLARWVPCLVVSLAGVVLDGMMAVEHGPGAVEHGVSTAALAAAMASVHARYVAHLLVPVGLSIDYAVDPGGSWASPLAWVGLALLVGAIVLLVVSWRRHRPLGLLAAGVWILGLLPVNNLWPRTAILMADRYLYLPAAGLYLLLLGLLARYRRGRAAVLALLVVTFGVLGVMRTGAFADARRVWADATEKEPESALAWYQRANDAGERGAWEAAAEWAQRAIDLAPRPEILVKARLLRTGALLAALDRREAQGLPIREEDLRQVLDEANLAGRLAYALETMPIVREDPREVQAEAEVLRGKALERWRDDASALDAYERAVTLWPANATAHYDVATLLADTRTADASARAERHLREALQHRPDFLDARIQLALVLARMGRMDEAADELERAERRHGRTPDLLYAMARVQLAGGRDVARAEELLHEIERTAPDHLQASRLLADIHLARGRALLERGRDEGDRAAMRAALERFDDAARVYERCWEGEVGAGDALLQLGRYREARARYQRAFDLAGGEPWIQRLVATTALLEAARLARTAEDDAELEEAARLTARAVQQPSTSLDVGFLPLQEELTWLRAVATRLDAGGDAAAHGSRVLRAAALAVTGDETGALDVLGPVFRSLAPDSPERDTLDAALMLRAHLRDRGADVEGARRDYRFLADRRPGDPLPTLWLLQCDLREARAHLAIAYGFKEDVQGIAEATAALERAADAIRSFADENRDVLSAGLLAAEADMHQRRWIDALKRLNDLKERFPREPRVHRGQAAIYVSQYLGVNREPTLVAEAARALHRALALDPRSPRTLLDASQVARVAGDLRLALEDARLARSYELVDHGPAAQALADLHVAIGREALKRGDATQALAAVKAAKRADPGGAAPWVLEGDVYLAARKYDPALEAYRTAKELEPLSAEAAQGLARVHRQRVLVFRMTAAYLRAPKHPREADPEAWARMDEAERAAAVAAWEAHVEKVEAERLGWRRREMREIEAALRLDPDAEENEELERRLAVLRDRDPEAQRKAVLEAEALYQEGRDDLEAGHLVQALALLQRATDTYPDYLPAHVYTALALHQLLLAPGDGSDEQRALEEKYWQMAFEALQAADALDPLDRFPQRHHARGLLDELRWRREGDEVWRRAARNAYERFLRAMDAAGREADPVVAQVRRALERLGEER